MRSDPHPLPAPRLALYPDDRKAALSLTFDDGFRGEVRDARAILDPLGLKGTFFIIPMGLEEGAENMINWQEARELLASGHELGTHGFTRFRLHEQEDALLDELVNGSWQAIRGRTGVAPVSYAVAGGSDWRDQRVRSKVFENHLFLREEILVYGNKPDRPWSDEETRRRLEAAGAAGEWVAACLHSIVGGYTPFDSKDDFRVHCEWLRAQDGWLWVAPMGTVGRYVRARESARVETRSLAPQGAEFRLVAEAGAAPLAVAVSCAGATDAWARAEDGSAIPAKVVRDEALLEATPGHGLISVRWT